jgi:hypothetical protein
MTNGRTNLSPGAAAGQANELHSVIHNASLALIDYGIEFLYV